MVVHEPVQCHILGSEVSSVHAQVTSARSWHGEVLRAARRLHEFSVISSGFLRIPAVAQKSVTRTCSLPWTFLGPLLSSSSSKCLSITPQTPGGRRHRVSLCGARHKHRLFASISVSIIASQTRVLHSEVIAIEQGSTPWRRTRICTGSLFLLGGRQHHSIILLAYITLLLSVIVLLHST